MWRFSLASCRALLPKTMLENVVPTKHKKAGGGKTASLRKARRNLLDFSLRACVFQLLLGFFSSSLGHRFLNGLRCTVDQVLRFLQAQARQFANSLNHGNLVATGFGQDNRELGLFFSCSSATAAACRARH